MTLKFKLDENLPTEAAEVLRSAGHDSVTVLDQSLGGTADSNLAGICRAEDRTLITLDLDFSNIQAYPPANHPGIIVLRPPTQDKPHVLKAIAAVIPFLAREPLHGRLWIVDEHRIRIRQ